MSKMLRPYVSIIVPCYNGEKTVGRLIQSIIDQTYDNIELIIVNDGSTDRSEEIVESYCEKIKNRGYVFRYVKQENKGLGGAINAGLKVFNGDYLCWADSDDYLEPQSVEHRIEFLIHHPEYAVVTSNAYVRESHNLDESHLLIKKVGEKELRENQFILMLNEESIFCSGCHMVRTEAFLDVNPEREIYPARRGQNWQMLLPVYYKYKRYFLNEPLYNYINYPNSMSKDKPTKEVYLSRYAEHEIILKNTLQMIEKKQNVDMTQFYCVVEDKYAKLRMNVALRFHDGEMFEREFFEKQKKMGTDKKDYFMYLQYKLAFIRKLVSWSRAVRGIKKK